MLESVHIQNFKGFRDTRIDGFCPVNLVIGGQNVGKTSLLEAVLFATQRQVTTTFRQNEGQDDDRLKRSISAQAGLQLQVVVAGKTYGAVMQTLLNGSRRAKLVADDPEAEPREEMHPTIAMPVCLPRQEAMVKLLGQVILARKKRDLLELLSQIEPRLQSLDAIAPDGEHRVYAELDGLPQALPLSHLGHGFSRLVHLFSELLVSDASLALVDEIENGIHYSALPTLFQGVRAVAQERQVQTLMTTHSWDALRAASEVFADTPELFQVIRLERTTDDNVEAVRIDGPRLQRLIAQDREVR